MRLEIYETPLMERRGSFRCRTLGRHRAISCQLVIRQFDYPCFLLLSYARTGSPLLIIKFRFAPNLKRVFMRAAPTVPCQAQI